MASTVYLKYYKIKNVMPKKTTEGELYMKRGENLANLENQRPERCIRPFCWSICCLLKHHQIIQWKDGCQEAIFKEEWLGGKVEVCYITQELDCVSVNMFDGGIRAAAKDFGCRLNCQFFVVVD